MGNQQEKRTQSYDPKAGKKKAYKPPPSPNLEKTEARRLGEQQFVAREQLTVPATKIVFDKKTQRFIIKAYDEPVNFLFDETRKHFIFSPRQTEEKQNKR